jgi:hypothetical protein
MVQVKLLGYCDFDLQFLKELGEKIFFSFQITWSAPSIRFGLFLALARIEARRG